MLPKTLPRFLKPFEKALLVFSVLAASMGFSGVEKIGPAAAPNPINTELRIGSGAGLSGAYSYRKALRNTKKDTFSGFFSQKTIQHIQVQHQTRYNVAATRIITLCPENLILTFVQRKNNPSPAEENSALLS